ncbi:MAG: hypothetical protein FJZ01_02880 [Candidatus Sericytochromatia bacterium]|nr:hypothetical protein [Candidatus Tanganyikabacteria bacterium]
MASDYDAIRQRNIKAYGEETRHLAFLGRLYVDRSHFIFELLQNAEDAQATSIEFNLAPDHLEVLHDGRRIFSEKDVIGICGVQEGTKAEDLLQIGKFGIGFKSVYAYTTRPEIYGGDEHFCIEHYVRPHAIPAKKVPAPWTTRFVFPFNQDKMAASQANREIRDRLLSLSPRTLLFLRNLRRLSWRAERGDQASIARTDEKSEETLRWVKVERSGVGPKDAERWLLASRPVSFPSGDAVGAVEAAFLLEVDKKGRVGISPAADTELVVFFPTGLSTGLGFLIHGPYVTTPARDNIPKDDTWNRKLVDETATLCVDTLFSLRDLGLMSVGLLEALPIRAGDFRPGSMFRPLYDHVRQALKEEPLLPAAEGGYVPGKRARLARSADLTKLVSPRQLGRLLDKSVDIHWLIPDITRDRTPEVFRYLVGETVHVDGKPRRVEPMADGMDIDSETFVRRLAPAFLAEQDDRWIGHLYAFFNGQRSLWKMLKTKPFVRLQSGIHVVPFSPDGRPQVFLSKAVRTTLPVAKPETYAKKEAELFLREFGITEPDATDEVNEAVIPCYGPDAQPIDAEQNLADVEAIIEAVNVAGGERKARLIERLRATAFLVGVDGAGESERYCSPSELYGRTPELEEFFAGNTGVWFLHDRYRKYQATLRELGVRSEVRITLQEPDATGYVIRAVGARVERGRDGFDWRCTVEGVEHAVASPTPERSMFIWNRLLVRLKAQITGTVEVSQRGAPNEKISRPSDLGHIVRKGRWIPLRGSFVRPEDLHIKKLPAGWLPDEDLASALGMRIEDADSGDEDDQMDPIDKLALEAEVDAYDIRFIKAHRAEFERFRRRLERQASEGQSNENAADLEADVLPVDFVEALSESFNRPGVDGAHDPERGQPKAPVPNPEFRRSRVAEGLAAQRRAEPSRESRQRLIVVREWEPKNEAVRVFLEKEYDGLCQICGDGFVKWSGHPYFEGVYLVSYTKAGWLDNEGNVLCLCATCSAKFQHGSVWAPDLIRQIETWRAQGEGGADPPKIRLELCSAPAEIRFTERHMISLQELLKQQAALSE